MQFTADYKAFGNSGELLRPAKIVSEVPHHQRLKALKQAALHLGLEVINYGVPIWVTLNMKKSELLKDDRKWLMYRGCDLPLSFVNEN